MAVVKCSSIQLSRDKNDLYRDVNICICACDAGFDMINKLISVSQSRSHSNHFPFTLTKSHLERKAQYNICVDTVEGQLPCF